MAAAKKYKSELLNTRETTHGGFEETAAIAQGLKEDLRLSAGWGKMPNTHREGLEMICTKLARAVSGDHDFKDHYDDIAGYAQLISARCTK